MFFEDLARLSEKSGQARQAEIYRECSEMAKQAKHNEFLKPDEQVIIF